MRRIAGRLGCEISGLVGCESHLDPAERLKHVMEEIRGPAGRNMWEKLSNVQPNVLANYLKGDTMHDVAFAYATARVFQVFQVEGFAKFRSAAARSPGAARVIG